MKTTTLIIFIITQLSFFSAQPMKGPEPEYPELGNPSIEAVTSVLEDLSLRPPSDPFPSLASKACKAYLRSLLENPEQVNSLRLVPLLFTKELLMQLGINAWLSDLWLQHLASLDQQPLYKEFPEIGTSRASFAWSPGGSCLAISYDNQIILWNPYADKSSTFVGITGKWYKGNFTWLTWSPDGSLLALAYGTKVNIINPYTRACLHTLESPDPVNCPAIWSPDSSLLAVAYRVFDPHTGQCLITIKNDFTLGYITWSPDSAYVAFCERADSFERYIEVRSRGTRKVVYKKNAQLVAWTPDNLFVTSQISHDNHFGSRTIWNPRTGEEHKEGWSLGSLYTWFDYQYSAISPNGRHCAVNNTKTTKIEDVCTGETLYELPHYGHDITWSPDGLRLVFQMGGLEMRIWNPYTNENSPTLPTQSYRDFIWSPDSIHLVCYRVNPNILRILILLDYNIINFLKTITPGDLCVLFKIKNNQALDAIDQALYDAFPACLRMLLDKQ